MSVLAQLERLDHALAGRPETEYVFEARKYRLRLAVATLLTLVSLAIALASNAAVAGWVLVVLSIATAVKNVLASRAHRATVPVRSGAWYER